MIPAKLDPIPEPPVIVKKDHRTAGEVLLSAGVFIAIALLVWMVISVIPAIRENAAQAKANRIERTCQAQSDVALSIELARVIRAQSVLASTEAVFVDQLVAQQDTTQARAQVVKARGDLDALDAQMMKAITARSEAVTKCAVKPAVPQTTGSSTP